MKNFEITSVHTIYTDDYENGVGDFVNSFDMTTSHYADDYKEAVNRHFQDICYNLGIEDCDIENNMLLTSCLVNSENVEPTGNELKRWEKGELVLYSDQITVTVYEKVEVQL